MDNLKLKKTKGFYCFGNFTLKVEEGRLWHGQELVSLTPKEFDVLFFLVERKGKIVEKNELLDEIWADSFVEEATLARNISWLRKKLRKFSKGEKFIETVPKRGYRFAAEVSFEYKPDQIIVEEQTVQHLEVEEVYFSNNGESQKPNERFAKAVKMENVNIPSISRNLFSLKAFYIVIGLATVFGGSFFAYQSFSTNYSVNNVNSSGNSKAPRLVNVALGKATRQSSNSEKNRGLSYEAVDGNTNGNWFQASVSNTGDDRMDFIKVRGTTDPWWEVDLEEVYDIEQIKIYNRTDTNSHYLKNFKIEIRNDPKEKFKPFVNGLHNYEDQRINPIIFKKKARARYIRIQVIGSGKFLSLAEVEVMGFPKPGEVLQIPEKCQPKATELSVFTGKNYRGECFVLDLRNYPAFDSPDGTNEKFYSLLVGEDIKAIACRKIDFEGKCEEVINRRSFKEPILSVKMADFFQLQDSENRCLEVNLANMGDSYPLKISDCDNSKNQQWFWTEWGQLRTTGDRCLDLSRGDRVVVTPCKRKSLSNDRLQRWVWTNQDEIRTATRNKTCLTVNESKDENDDSVIIKECDFSENQKWKFVK